MREETYYDKVIQLCRYKWKLIGTRVEYNQTIGGLEYKTTVYILGKR